MPDLLGPADSPTGPPPWPTDSHPADGTGDVGLLDGAAGVALALHTSQSAPVPGDDMERLLAHQLTQGEPHGRRVAAARHHVHPLV